MTLQRFIDYLEMDKSLDPCYRAYDLLYGAGPTRLRYALRAVGFNTGDKSMDADALIAALRSRGVIVFDSIRDDLCEWFVWDRLNRGVISRWRERKAK